LDGLDGIKDGINMTNGFFNYSGIGDSIKDGCEDRDGWEDLKAV
jgi:hypothetical protein